MGGTGKLSQLTSTDLVQRTLTFLSTICDDIFYLVFSARCDTSVTNMSEGIWETQLARERKVEDGLRCLASECNLKGLFSEEEEQTPPWIPRPSWTWPTRSL